jgi:NADH-quinone oxidoreductase subunit L
MKLTFWVYLIGAIALAGIPPLAGFWSKDEILAEANVFVPAAYWLLTGAALLTAFYMTRQIIMVFFGQPRSLAAEHAKESPPIMTVPLIILAILSIFGGLLNLPTMHTFAVWLEHASELYHAGEFIFIVAIISVAIALLAIGLGWYLYQRRYRDLQLLPTAKRPDDPLRQFIGPVFTWLNNKWYIDELYEKIIIHPYILLSRFLAEQVDWRFWHDWFHDKVILAGYNGLTRLLAVRIDLGLIDGFANGLAAVTQRLAARLRRVQSGYVRNYALSIFIGVVIILTYLIIR